jgi:hypothetical protein
MAMQRIRILLPVFAAFVLVGGAATPAAASHNTDQHSAAARHLAHIPRSSDFRFDDPAVGRSFQSDLAFQGRLAIAGNYNGFRIIDISRPAHPRVVRDVWCPGAQNDVSIWGDAIVTSVDEVLTGSACGSPRAASETLETGWEGVRIFSLRQILATAPGAGGFTRVQPVAAVCTPPAARTPTPECRRAAGY